MILTSQYKVYDNFYKIYNFEESTIIDLINLINNSDIEIKNIYIDENVEKNMKSIQGTYSIQEILENYNELIKQALYPTEVSLSINGLYNNEKIQVIFKTKTKDAILITANFDLELDKILTHKENKTL